VFINGIMSKLSKFFSVAIVIILVVLGVIFYFKFFFPVATEAVKSGELNYIMYKGYIWKTYEGKLIQAGFRPKTDTGSGVQSNEFDFSIEDEELAKELMHHAGKVVSLKYRQYNGALPWRGMERNIVYAIDNIEPRQGNSLTPNDSEQISNLPFDE